MKATASEQYQNSPTTGKRFPAAPLRPTDHCYRLLWMFYLPFSHTLSFSALDSWNNKRTLYSQFYCPLRLCLFLLFLLLLAALFLFSPPAVNN